MNHYPHHLGDYAKATSGFTMLEHGAYRLLLDSYYATEKPLPKDDVYAIAKAGSTAERKAVQKVLAKKFELRDGAYWNERVEEELAAYRQRSGKASAKANARWEKERAQRMPQHMPQHMQEHEPQQSRSSPAADAGAMLASNQKPEPETTAFPVLATSGAEPAPAGGEKNPEPQPIPEARVAGLSALLTKARVTDVASCKPLMERWLSQATDSQITRAVNDACRSKGGHPFQAAYLDPIVVRIVDEDRKARDAAASRLRNTEAQIAAQREAAQRASPMPDHLKPRRLTA